LQHTKQKPIKLSTLKNKLTEWQRDLRSERDVYEMGADAFYDLGTHSNSTKLVIQIVRMQEVALQRQDHERVYADPARNDPNIALAVRMPGPVAAPQSQNPRVYPDTVEGRFLAAQEHYAAQRAAARPAARAAGCCNKCVCVGYDTKELDYSYS
jgi:hypothetical protein